MLITVSFLRVISEAVFPRVELLAHGVRRVVEISVCVELGCHGASTHVSLSPRRGCVCDGGGEVGGHGGMGPPLGRRRPGMVSRCSFTALLASVS